MRTLITGASGFLGSQLCRRLLSEGHAVRVLVRRTSDLSLLEGLGVEVVHGDVTAPASLNAALAGCTHVVHAAASLSYWERDGSTLHQTNEIGTRNVAQACRRRAVARLVHVSSVAAIGIPDGPERPADEALAFNLEGCPLPYHLSKRRAEDSVRAEVARGLDAVIVNPASIFGPHGRSYRGAGMMSKVRQTRVVPYFTGGLCTAHVDDVASGIIAALRHGVVGERYILGGENLSYRALATRTARAMGIERVFVPLPAPVVAAAAGAMAVWAGWRGERPRLTRTVHYCAGRFQYYDSGKARERLGYAPRDFGAILDECLRFGAC